MVPNKMVKPIQIVQGAQYGSEGKGAVAAYFAVRNDIDFAVRTGATNAGHTVMHQGAPIKMQQLPVGWVNPTTQLVLGAGALIDLDILAAEVKLVDRAMAAYTGSSVLNRLVIDYRASIHDHTAAQRSRQSDRHHLIGATGKGCSEALMDKIKQRGMTEMCIGRRPEGRRLPLADTARLLNSAWDGGASVQLEGTQGTLLDLHLGPYPYVTHKQTGPAQWMMECGLSPALPTDIVLVARTYPIRVAGNSGPLPQEISWPKLARDINDKLVAAGARNLVPEWDIVTFEDAVRAATAGRWAQFVPRNSDGLDQHQWSPEDRLFYRDALSEIHRDALHLLSDETLASLSRLFELTTVTKKLRRVAELSMVDLRQSVMLCRPHRLVVTFMNYVYPQYWGLDADHPPSVDELEYVDQLERVLGVPVSHFTRGPGSEHVVSLLDT